MDTTIMKTLQDATRHQMTNVKTFCCRIDSEINRLGGGDGFEGLLYHLRRLVDESALLEVAESLHLVTTNKQMVSWDPIVCSFHTQ